MSKPLCFPYALDIYYYPEAKYPYCQKRQQAEYVKWHFQQKYPECLVRIKRYGARKKERMLLPPVSPE